MSDENLARRVSTFGLFGAGFMAGMEYAEGQCYWAHRLADDGHPDNCRARLRPIMDSIASGKVKIENLRSRMASPSAPSTSGEGPAPG